MKKFAKALGDQITSIYLETPKPIRETRMLLRKDSPELIVKRLASDDLVFIKEELPLNYVLLNEGIALEALADKVYDLYKNKKA